MFLIEIALSILGQALVFHFIDDNHAKKTKWMILFSLLAPIFIIKNASAIFIGIFFGTLRGRQLFYLYRSRLLLLKSESQLLECLYYDVMTGNSVRSSLKNAISQSTANAPLARQILISIEENKSEVSTEKTQRATQLQLAIHAIEKMQLRPMTVISALRIRKKHQEIFRRRSRAMSLNPKIQFGMMTLFFLIVACIYFSQNCSVAPRNVLYGTSVWFFFGGILYFRIAGSFKWKN